MRLKSIKLAGFKSFAEPTRLDFPGNITCIVGPNGCGKSNTLDAIRWVMGESAARALRGGEMNDVLFNGTARRKAVSQCSVELIFDNSDHRLKGAWNRYAELSVRRVHHREQGTQYYLNAQRCRRRDITALFDGTGLGPRSYALIGQGNISHIIESRPEQLRLFLEEAAGVGYYRQRRRETQSRLQTTQENLAQLQIQYNTWQTQAEQLKQQCEAAERYRTLSDEIAQLSRWRYQLQYQSLSDKLEALNQRLQPLQQAQGRHVLQAERLQKEILLVEKQLPAQRQIISQLQRQVHQLDKTLALQRAEQTRQQQEIQRLETEIDAQSQQLQAIEAQREQLQRNHDDQAQAQLPLLSQQLHQAQQQLTAKEAQLRQAQSRSQALQEQIHALNQQLLAAERQRDRHRQQLEQARFKAQQIKQQQAIIQQRLDALTITALEDELNQRQREKHACHQQRQQLEQTLTAHQAQQQQAQQQLETHRQQVMALAGELTALSAELKGLRQAQAQVVPTSAEGVKLLAQIRVQVTQWQAAIEAWLGQWLQGQVVPDWPEEITEDIPFLGVDVPPPSPKTPPYADWRPLSELLQAPGCILQAASTIWCSDQPPSPAQLRALSPEQSVLTPEGRLWHAYGVEYLHTDLAGVLARQARIQSLEEQLQPLQRKKAQLEAALVQAEQAVQQRRAQSQTFKDALREQSDRHHRLSLEIEQLQQQLNRQRQERTQLQQQLQSFAAALQGHAHTEAEAQQALKKAQNHIEALDGQLEQLKRAYQTQRQSITVLEEEVSTIRSEIKALSNKVETLKQEEADHRQQLATLQARRLQLADALAQQQTRLKTLEKELIDEGALQRLQQQLAQEQQTLQQKRTHLQQQEAQLKRLRQQLQQAEKQAYEYQAQLAAVQLELEQTHTALHNCVQEAESAGLNPDQLRQAPLEAPELQTVEKRLRQAQKVRERLGAVNMTAIEASAQLQAQMRELETQMADIRSAVETLQQSIRKIDRDSRRRLRETFDQVNAHFMRLFPVIFRGGKAQLQWLDPDMDPLENGVLVMAQPPGKRTTRIQMLSGGEKTLTALALIFALFELNPAPFCVLDEVDAPLDDANVMHFCELVKAMAKQVQFILITHNKTTMTMAEQLLGVTMHEPGVSRVVSVDLHTAVDMILRKQLK